MCAYLGKQRDETDSACPVTSLGDIEQPRDNLVSALARCQGKFPVITRNRENAHFKSSYADLGAILAAVRPVLAAEGIAVTQTSEITDAGVDLVTSLRKGDERIESRWPLPVDGLGSQQIGSLRTYIRRYELSALLGVAADDDDDGNASKDVIHRASTGKGTPPSEKSINYLAKLRGELVKSDAEWKMFCAAVLDGELPDIPSGPDTSKLIDALLQAKRGDWPKNMFPADKEPF